jgi:hypothetical protein
LDLPQPPDDKRLLAAVLDGRGVRLCSDDVFDGRAVSPCLIVFRQFQKGLSRKFGAQKGKAGAA